MKIKNRFTGKLIIEIKCGVKADLREADLWEADLRKADLRKADLRGADLRGADLRGADLDDFSCLPLWCGSFDMKVDDRCPECKGEKGWNVQDSEYWEPPRYKWVKCHECKGVGRVSSLHMATYKGRGGPAPGMMQGW